MTIYEKHFGFTTPYRQSDDVVFKRGLCEWVLPVCVAEKIVYNKRLVPMVIQPKEISVETHLRSLSIHRILLGYRVHSELNSSDTSSRPSESNPLHKGDQKCTSTLPASPFTS